MTTLHPFEFTEYSSYALDMPPTLRRLDCKLVGIDYKNKVVNYNICDPSVDPWFRLIVRLVRKSAMRNYNSSLICILTNGDYWYREFNGCLYGVSSFNEINIDYDGREIIMLLIDEWISRYLCHAI